jgi:hypothetical protein
MKKSILIFAAMAAISSTSFAQETPSDSRDKLHLGAKIGANYSNVYDSEGDEFKADAKLGFAGGAFLAIPIGKFIGLQPEVLVSQKGFKATGRVLGSQYNFTRTSTYLDVPLFLALKPAPVFTILVGPQFSYLMHQKDAFASASTELNTEQEFKNENIRKNILCFVGGFDINIDPVVIGARAGWDVQNNHGDGSSNTPRYKNMWFQGTVGLRF